MVTEDQMYTKELFTFEKKISFGSVEVAIFVIVEIFCDYWKSHYGHATSGNDDRQDYAHYGLVLFWFFSDAGDKTIIPASQTDHQIKVPTSCRLQHPLPTSM